VCGEGGKGSLVAAPSLLTRSAPSPPFFLPFFHSIGDEGCTALASIIAASAALAYLNVRCNRIGDRGAEELAAAIAAPTSATLMPARHSLPIPTAVVRAGYHKGPRHGNTHEYLSYPRAPRICRCPVQELYIGVNPIGEAGCAALARAWAAAHSLVSLDMQARAAPSSFPLPPTPAPVAPPFASLDAIHSRPATPSRGSIGHTHAYTLIVGLARNVLTSRETTTDPSSGARLTFKAVVARSLIGSVYWPIISPSLLTQTKLATRVVDSHTKIAKSHLFSPSSFAPPLSFPVRLLPTRRASPCRVLPCPPSSRRCAQTKPSAASSLTSVPPMPSVCHP